MAELQFDTYGKTAVRLTHVDRTNARHEVRELNVNIFFEGDFADSYRTGSNASVLPTDTMKNTVYVLAKHLRWSDPETFARGLTGHFLSHLPHLRQVTVQIAQVPWERIGEHPAAFRQAGDERRTAEMIATRSGRTLKSGLRNLQVLKTTNSAFTGFIKDEFTTLAETEDRLFGTVISADWSYSRPDIEFNGTFARVREVMMRAFSEHRSLSVQQTLFAMAEAVLADCELVEEIHLKLPNKHCLLVDLERFGLENPNQIFVPIDEPSGYIEARVTR
ncbi:MAG: factor-independent urate hydroxylase [Bryobacteraceae bacterium]